MSPSSSKLTSLYIYVIQFGGGRNIRPGEALETPEDRAAKEARTRQLIAAYKRKMHGIKYGSQAKSRMREGINRDNEFVQNL